MFTGPSTMRYLALSCLVLALLPACRNGKSNREASSQKDVSWAPTREAEVYFSTEVDGYVEPCGCTSEPLGGIQRLATVIKSGHANRGLIDAGNLLFPVEGIDDTTRGQHLLKARMLARAYRDLGLMATNLGASDLEGGMSLLKELQREGAFPFVSANVRPVGEGAASVARSFVREIGGIKVGVTGVATPESFSGDKAVTAIEYAPVVGAELSRLREAGAEVVVVLAHIGGAGAEELARAVPDIDVIIYGPGTPITRAPSAPRRVGSVIVTEAGSQGQHVGRMTLRFGPKAPTRPVAFDDGGYAEKKKRRLIERKLEALRRQIRELSAKPNSKEAVKNREVQAKALEAKLQAATSAARLDRPSIKVELVPLTVDVAADAAMTQLLTAYYAQLKDMNAQKGDVSLCVQKDAKKPVYVGTQKCVECHEEAFEFWKKTKHAKAWETLEKDNKHFDLTCIGCHTIGYQQPGGFCRLSDVGVLKDVGCENCHGPGSLHAEDQDPSSIVLEAPEATCAGFCHVPEHSDQFEYAKYVREITGEGHELSTP